MTQLSISIDHRPNVRQLSRLWSATFFNKNVTFNFTNNLFCSFVEKMIVIDYVCMLMVGNFFHLGGAFKNNDTYATKSNTICTNLNNFMWVPCALKHDTNFFQYRNLSAIQDREICCYSISCKEKENIGKNSNSYFILYSQKPYADTCKYTYISGKFFSGDKHFPG